MKTYAARLACLLVLTGWSLSARAQQLKESEIRSKVLALEQLWNQAEGVNDLRALDTLFDNRLVYVEADGSLMTKAEFLARAKSAHMEQVTTQAMTVQVFGETAIVTGTYLVKEFKEGKSVQRRGRFVDAWVRHGQAWVCVAAQATPILP
jgi:ketosteroid isomerase-like protein